MQVNCKLTVNDGNEMGERRLWAAVAARRRWQVPCPTGTTSHNRTLSGSETAYFGGWKKFFTLSPAYKSLPQLLGQDFVVNFATYTRVYTVGSVLGLAPTDW